MGFVWSEGKGMGKGYGRKGCWFLGMRVFMSLFCANCSDGA
jgi:hypothetical protein